MKIIETKKDSIPQNDCPQENASAIRQRKADKAGRKTIKKEEKLTGLSLSPRRLLCDEVLNREEYTLQNDCFKRPALFTLSQMAERAARWAARQENKSVIYVSETEKLFCEKTLDTVDYTPQNKKTAPLSSAQKVGFRDS